MRDNRDDEQKGTADNGKDPPTLRDTTTIVASLGRNIGAGTQLNGFYEVDAHIATGGMGEVFRGHFIETGGQVALKIVLPEFARDDTIRELFRKEARILQDLIHPAIVRYYGFARDPVLERHYLAMEYIAAEPLSDHVLKEPLSAEETTNLAIRLASGLQVAHNAGVIHRDLSPDNIMLPAGDVLEAKIIDFGIAKSTSGGNKTLLGGKFAGKYNYVSPEQLGLFGGEITPRSDIYSLGLVLASAVLGKPLDMSGSQLDVIEKRRKVPDLSQIDPSLSEVLSLLLQPDPKHRPHSMSDVVGLLEGTLDTQDFMSASSNVSSEKPQTAPSDSDRTVIADASPMVAVSVADNAPSTNEEITSHSPFGAFETDRSKTDADELTETVSSAEAKKKSKTGLVAASIVVVLAASGAAAYFSGAFDSTKTKQVVASTPPPVEEVVPPTPVPSPEIPKSAEIANSEGAGEVDEVDSSAIADAQEDADAMFAGDDVVVSIPEPEIVAEQKSAEETTVDQEALVQALLQPLDQLDRVRNSDERQPADQATDQAADTAPIAEEQGVGASVENNSSDSDLPLLSELDRVATELAGLPTSVAPPILRQTDVSSAAGEQTAATQADSEGETQTSTDLIKAAEVSELEMTPAETDQNPVEPEPAQVEEADLIARAERADIGSPSSVDRDRTPDARSNESEIASGSDVQEAPRLVVPPPPAPDEVEAGIADKTERDIGSQPSVSASSPGLVGSEEKSDASLTEPTVSTSLPTTDSSSINGAGSTQLAEADTAFEENDMSQVGSATPERKEETPVASASPNGFAADDREGKPPEKLVARLPDPPSPRQELRASTPSAWVNQFDLGNCSFARILSENSSSARIEAFGTEVAPFVRLMNTYEDEFDIEPDIEVRQISEKQCPVVDMLATTSLGQQSQLTLKLERDLIRSGDGLVGTVEGLGGERDYLFLIDNDGIAYNISQHLKPTQGAAGSAQNIAQFRMRLALPSKETQPQLLLAISTDQPLRSVTGPQAFARIFMPALAAELASRGNRGSAVAKYFRIEN